MDDDLKARKTTRARAGKIEVHSRGIGALGEADLERRARELALIDGHAEPTPDDWDQARAELSGGVVEPGEDDSMTDSLSRDPSDPPANRGEQVPDIEEPDDDEEEVAERLVSEGVEEAEHDQMLAARKKRNL
jgi:hypothetical protein